MFITETFRAKLEDVARNKPAMTGIWVVTSIVIYFSVHWLFVGLYQAQKEGSLFSATMAAFVVLAFYAWSRISVLNRDVTTGLYRRQVAERCLNRIENQQKDVTLVMIDLNNLKGVNDADGHDAGDVFIRDAARRVARLGRVRGRMVSRFGGGDEFLIICEGPVDKLALAEEVDEALHAKHPLSHLWGLGCAGIARSRTGEVRIALECADAALLRAKRLQKTTQVSHVLIYDSAKDGPPRYHTGMVPPRPLRRRRDGGS